MLNVFDGQLKITNMEWDENLQRKSSEIYQIVSKEIEGELTRLFSDLPSDAKSQVQVRVNRFAPGSVVVDFTVGWLTESAVLTSSIVRNWTILCTPSHTATLHYVTNHVLTI